MAQIGGKFALNYPQTGCERPANGYLTGMRPEPPQVRPFALERGSLDGDELPAWNGGAGVSMMMLGHVPPRPWVHPSIILLASATP